MIFRKSILRTIKNTKLQYGGAILLLLLGVMVYVMLSASLQTVERSNIDFIKRNNQEDFHFFPSGQLTNINQLQKKLGITLEDRWQKDVKVLDNRELRIFTITDKVNIPYVQDGRLPENDSEIAISTNFADKNRLKVGDSLKVAGQDFLISGTIILPDYVYGIKNETDLYQDPQKFSTALMTKEGLLKVTNLPVLSYHGKMNHTKIKQSTIKKEISKAIPVLKWLNRKDNTRITYVETKIEGSKATTTTLPIMILFLTILMISILIKRRIEIHRKQIGTLKAIGYRDNEIIKNYLLFPFTIGVIGSVLGVVIGICTSIPLTEYYLYFYNLPLLAKVNMNPITIILAILIPVVVLMTTGFFVIKKQIQASPLDLMKNEQASMKNVKWAKMTSFNGIKSFKMRFRLRTLLRNGPRLFYLAIGIIFSTMLLMYGFITMNSMDDLMTMTYEKVMKYDYGLYYNSLQKGTSSGDEDVFSFTEVEIKKTKSNEKTVKWKDEKISLYGIDENPKLLNLFDKSGKDLDERLNDTIIISKVLAHTLDLQKGDEIVLYHEGNDQEKTYKVGGIAEIYMGNYAYVERDELNKIAGYPHQSYFGKWTKKEPTEGTYLMVEDKRQVMDSFESLMGPMSYSIYLMAWTAFVIGVIIISLLTNLMVEENTSAISLMKVIGYQDSMISQLMINVYTPVVILSYFIGIPLAIFSLDTLLTSMAEQTNFIFPISVKPLWMVLGLVIILLTYYASLFISKYKIKKISLQEVLKHQEV